MASISSFLFFRHLRSDPSFHVIQYRSGRKLRSGRGLSFWFLPLWTSIAKIPCDDRNQSFLVRGRSSDFQEVTTQGVVTYRVREPEKLAQRVDFSVDSKSGAYQKMPMEQLAQLLSGLAQQFAEDYLVNTSVQDILRGGVERIRNRISEGLPEDPSLWALGVEIVSIRIASVAPTAELEKALQAPMREEIQQASDEATFQRRALAVEKERAIQENELQNQIELAKREESLIAQRGQNELRRSREDAAARKIEAEGKGERTRLEAGARAEGIRVVEKARVDSERERMDIYRDLPSTVIVGLAAQELAGKLQRIEHLNISPDLIGPMLTNLITTGTRHLEGNGKSEA